MQGLHAVVIDDSAFFRRGITEWLHQERVASVSAVLGATTQMVFLGFNQQPTADFLAEISEADIPVVAFVDSASGAWLHALLDVIPSGAILHRTAPESVVRDAVAAALRGSQYMDREIIPVLVEWGERRLDALGLTAREQQVARKLVSGCSNKQIAQDLGIATSTVKQHVAVVMRKTRSSSRHDVARMFPITARRMW